MQISWLDYNKTVSYQKSCYEASYPILVYHQSIGTFKKLRIISNVHFLVYVLSFKGSQLWLDLFFSALVIKIIEPEDCVVAPNIPHHTDGCSTQEFIHQPFEFEASTQPREKLTLSPSKVCYFVNN